MVHLGLQCLWLKRKEEKGGARIREMGSRVLKKGERPGALWEVGGGQERRWGKVRGLHQAQFLPQ